jgi:hypothetical protein
VCAASTLTRRSRRGPHRVAPPVTSGPAAATIKVRCFNIIGEVNDGLFGKEAYALVDQKNNAFTGC